MAVSLGVCLCLLAACGSVGGGRSVRADEPAAVGLPAKVEFDGFDLDLRPGRTTVARALRGMPTAAAAAAGWPPVELVVKGPPSSRAGSGSMSAEIEQRFAFLNVAAGFLADRESVFTGPAGWTSRMAMEFQGEQSSGGFELRTQLRQTETTGTVGIEIGPRLEHRLPSGTRLFFNGSARARALYDRTGELTATRGPLQQTEVVSLSGTVGIAR